MGRRRASDEGPARPASEFEGSCTEVTSHAGACSVHTMSRALLPVVVSRLGELLVASGLAAVLGACLESGPLKPGLTTRPTETAGDANTDPDVSDGDAIGTDDGSGADTVDGVPGDGVSEVGDATDAGDGDGADSDGAGDTNVPADTEDADDSDSGPVRACLVDNDCQGLVQADLCDGPLRCIDYGCRADPGARVECTGAGPCREVRCNPATGLCEDEDTCSCEAPRTLQCGIAASWSTSDAGAQDNVAAYGCGPARVSDDMRLFALAVSGRVRISASGDLAGLHVLGGDVCDGVSECVAGAKHLLYFDAVAGERYTLAAEDGLPNQFVSVRADCDITSETDCRDGLDDDGDGASDCDERECDGIAGCVLPPEVETGLCHDSLDNDLDGGTDCDDPDCGDDSGCLERCELLTGSVYCNYKQGLSNGSGKARSTHYACNPVPQTAKEMVFHIEAGFTGRVRIGFAGAGGLALHLLKETGRGCTPRDCVAMSSGDLFIDLVEGDVYYLAIDGPGAVVGEFNIQIDCLE